MGLYLCFLFSILILTPGVIAMMDVKRRIKEIAKSDHFDLESEQLFLSILGLILIILGLCFFGYACLGFLKAHFGCDVIESFIEMEQLKSKLGQTLYHNLDWLYATEWILSSIIICGGLYICGNALSESYKIAKNNLEFKMKFKKKRKHSFPYYIKEVLISSSIVLLTFLILKYFDILP